MSSSRLPGKVLMPLAGRPMIWHIVQRAMACDLIDRVVVATSTENSDDPLCDFCEQEGIVYHRGSLHDVLGRFLRILKGGNYKYCARITGDCPLIHPSFIDAQIHALEKHSGDFCWNRNPISVLEGQGVHSVSSLQKVSEKSRHEDDREHVGSRYFAENPEEFRIVELVFPSRRQSKDWRLTVDEKHDYRMMSLLYENLSSNFGDIIPLAEALKWLNANPEVAKINQNVCHSEINRELQSRRLQWEGAISGQHLCSLDGI